MRRIQPIKHSKINLFALVAGIMFFILAPVVLGDAVEAHRTVANDLADLSNRVLVERGLCKDKIDCYKKEFVLFRRLYPGAALELYNVQDLEAIRQIIDICVRQYEKNQGREPIHLRAWMSPHSEYVGVAGIFRRMNDDPFIEVLLKGEK